MSSGTKRIGILSGSGPAAGLFVVDRLHQYMQTQYGAAQDGDYPDYVLYNKPLQGFDETGIVDQDLVQSSFISAMKDLFSMGVSVVGIACNTLHILLDHVVIPPHVQFIHMVEATASAAASQGGNVLLVASSTTRRQGLYDEYIPVGVCVIHVSDQQQILVDGMIEAVMAGKDTREHLTVLQSLVSQYTDEHPIDAIVLGCTELPVITHKYTHLHDIPLFSSTDVLVRGLVEAYYGA